MSTGLESVPYLGWPEPGQASEEARELGQDPPIRSRVGDQQQEFLGRVVAALEIDAADHGLDVAEPHLEFDRRPASGSVQDGIPGTLLEMVLDGRE